MTVTVTTTTTTTAAVSGGEGGGGGRVPSDYPLRYIKSSLEPAACFLAGF